MIVIEDLEDVLKVHVYAEFTLGDFREFEDAVTNELREYEHVNVLFDLTNMERFSMDMAMEELKFNKQHAHDYERIAVVTDNQWHAWVGWLAGAFVDAEVQQFDDPDNAAAWLETG
jgi:uncharacterized protein YkvS